MDATALSIHTDMSFWGLFLQAGWFVKIIMLGLFASSVAVWAVWVGFVGGNFMYFSYTIFSCFYI